MKQTTRIHLGHRFGAFVLALCMALSLLPVLSRSADAAFSDAAMDKLNNWGVLNGYPDGSLRPERNLTRAEFVAMVNRAYGYKDVGQTPFIDVAPSAWYHDDVGAAYKAGYFNGYSPRMAYPDSELTREQAVVMLARNMRLDPVAGEVTEFSDGRSCADWSRGYIRAAQQAGMIGGYSDGSFKPQNDITRGEMAVMLQRALGTLVNTPGVHTLSDTYGNVTISTPNATLRDTTIAGDLYITGGLDLGDITLENVRVLGDIVVAGGGESQNSKDSIVLRNVEADSLMVDSIADQYVSLSAEGDTVIGETSLRSDAFVQDRTRPGQGLLNIALESPDVPAAFTLSGNLETVVNKTPGSTLNIAMGTVDSLTIDEKAKNATLNLDINSTATELNLDVATNVTGVGDIKKLNVSAPGAVVSMLPDTIVIRPGLTANVAGQDLNAAQAIESSSDPRLLAGYPKVKNIAPTSALSIYDANKAGTVYWAVSTTTDGSIGEDELIKPTAGNTRIALNGNLPIAASNTEYTAAFEKLVPDSNYYLSAIMVDARDRHSPVKVMSFTTPDNSVPAFAREYPRVVFNEARRQYDKDHKLILNDNGDPVIDFTVQVAAMPTKSCQLYYALYFAGGNAPTGQAFRSGNLGATAHGYSGVDDVSKNQVWTKTFSGLKELQSYDLYLWLTDADGARSSAVQKLTFKTIDGTPPRFITEPTVSKIDVTSLSLTTSLNEDGTVYWVAVTSDTEYPKPDKNNELDEDWAQIQIANGMNGLRAGSVNVKAKTDAIINVTGLQGETEYTIYFIAKDLAGNYSLITVTDNKLIGNSVTESTLDTNPPTVRQEFTDTPLGEPTHPFPSTDIKIIFSENVLWSKAESGKNARLIDLYNAAHAEGATDADKEMFRSVLSRTIQMYNAGSSRSVTVSERKSDADANWVIDYRNARVEQEGKELIVIFPTTDDTNHDSALHLRSGSTYYFEIHEIADTSANKNLMGVTKLDDFTTVFAQVDLGDLNVTEIECGGKTIRADAVFSLTPNATSSSDADINWDMIVWSDVSIKFDLYRRVVNTAGTATDWVKCQSEGEVVIPSGYKDKYIGQSLQFQLDEGGMNSKITELKDDGTVYEYAVHIKELEEEPEADPSQKPDTWSKSVDLWISVMAAPIRGLNRLANSLYEETYRTLTGEPVVVTDISAPKSFTITIPFKDDRPPEFYEKYPMIIPTDTSVDFSALLDRPGTVYYVIAPVGSIVTTEKVGETNKDIPFGDVRVPEALWAADGRRTTDIFEVDQPRPGRIIAPSSTVVSDNFKVDTTVVTKHITGLTASTQYFLYVVLSGESTNSQSKKVQLFQFKTKDAYRPDLWVQRPLTDQVTITSRDMDSSVEYALFQMDLIGSTILGQSFSQYATDQFKTDYPTTEGSPAINTTIRNYKVYEAIQNRPNSTGTDYNSYFDLYATQDFKMQILELVNQTATTSNDVYVGGTGGTPILIPLSKSETVNCATSFQLKNSPISYYFIAVGRYAHADPNDLTGDSYAFRATSPIIKSDRDIPRVTNISGVVTVDYTATNGPKIDGDITIQFDKNLYLYDASTNRPAIHLVSGNTASTENGTPFIPIGALVVSKRGLDPKVDNTNRGKYTDNVTLAMSSMTGTFILSDKLSSQSSEAIGEQLILQVDLNASNTGNDYHPAVCSLQGRSDRWASGEKFSVYVEVLSTAVAVERITLDKSNVTLDSVNSFASTLRATVVPDNATDQTVQWTTSDANVVTIDQSTTQSGETIHINATTSAQKTGGQATITATCGGKSASCTVTVTPSPSISIEPGWFGVKSGTTETLTLTLKNYNGSDTSWYVTPTVYDGSNAVNSDLFSWGIWSQPKQISPGVYQRTIKVEGRATTQTVNGSITFRVVSTDSALNDLTAGCSYSLSPSN